MIGNMLAALLLAAVAVAQTGPELKVSTDGMTAVVGTIQDFWVDQDGRDAVGLLDTRDILMELKEMVQMQAMNMTAMAEMMNEMSGKITEQKATIKAQAETIKSLSESLMETNHRLNASIEVSTSTRRSVLELESFQEEFSKIQAAQEDRSPLPRGWSDTFSTTIQDTTELQAWRDADPEITDNSCLECGSAPYYVHSPVSNYENFISPQGTLGSFLLYKFPGSPPADNYKLLEPQGRVSGKNIWKQSSANRLRSESDTVCSGGVCTGDGFASAQVYRSYIQAVNPSNAPAPDTVDVEISNEGAFFDLVKAFTLQAWVKPANNYDGYSRSRPIVYKTARERLNEDTYSLTWVYRGAEMGYFYIVREQASDGKDWRAETQSFKVNEWYDVVATYGGDDMKIFVNGELQDTVATGPMPAFAGPAPLHIGSSMLTNHGASGQSSFTGDISEVRIYDLAATDDAIIGKAFTAPIESFQPAAACGNLLITGVIDGPLTGGIPKAIELMATADIPDMSIFALGVANNGGGTDDHEFEFPAVSAAKGDFLYVSSEKPGFQSFFGFAPDYVDGFAGVNGDDAVELFCNAAGNGHMLVDLFGDVNVKGTGEPWEYLDGWAYRKNGGTQSATFTLESWMFSGANALDGGNSNSNVSPPFPNGAYMMKESGLVAHYNFEDIADCSKVALTGVLNGPLTGNQPRVVELFVLQDIDDLSIYSVGAAKKVAGDGSEFQLPVASAKKGDFLHIATNAAQFASYFGFDTPHIDPSLIINGDDAVALYCNSQSVDVFGMAGVDGTGASWEYTGGYAYRMDTYALSGNMFMENQWTVTDPNILVGATAAADAVPFGTYSPPVHSPGVLHDMTGNGRTGIVPHFTVTDGHDVSDKQALKYGPTLVSFFPYVDYNQGVAFIKEQDVVCDPDRLKPCVCTGSGSSSFRVLDSEVGLDLLPGTYLVCHSATFSSDDEAYIVQKDVKLTIG